MTLQPLLAYIPWHARDGVVRALTSPLMFALLAGIPLGTMTRDGGLASVATDPRMREFGTSLYLNFGSLAMTLGAVLQTSNVVALDRERQYYRFLFAHQVAPWMYYLQRYVVGIVLFVALFMLVPIVYSQVVLPVSILGALKAAVLFGTFVGSLALLCGAFTKRDGLALIGTYLVAASLQPPVVYAALPTWAQWLSKLLPPAHAAAEVRDAWMKGTTAVSADLWLTLGWTAGMLVTALFVIRRLPLAR
jgi:hypothetical protein